MITVQSHSPLPTTKKPLISPAMDARLLRSPKPSNRMNRTRSLVIVRIDATESSLGNVNRQVNSELKTYHRHRSSLKENMQGSLNAAWKEEDPDLYKWATKQKQDENHKRSVESRSLLRSPSARRLRKALSFNANKKTITGSTPSKDPASIPPTNHEAKDGILKQSGLRSMSFRHPPIRSTSQASLQEKTSSEFLAVPLHLQVVSKQPITSPSALKRSASARSFANDHDSSSPVQRSTSARDSGQSASVASGDSSPAKRSRSTRISCHPADNETDLPTLRRARSARMSRNNSMQLRDFFGSLHRGKSQSDLGNKSSVHRRRSLHGDSSGILRDSKEKGYISSFLGSEVSHQSRFRRSSGCLA